ncbi:MULTISPECIES: hypothetical protein [Thermococcus]|uniref:Uncharacterized protein n=1 Tax=Thermococcus barossii TaxID=54077 RepID=A0A2Z2MTQ8_9EURY|nr:MULTISPECIES: hypothetical protein [Thermococcus]ASJ05378.1 hypothetical protein A3L01_08385 [Thermococcus barossii]NJE76530.1 hypothetical protein [Thermococcus sp. ES12]
MRRSLALSLIFTVLLSFLSGVCADYLGAESVDFHVLAVYGDSAVLSLVYVPYSTSMSGALVPTGYFHYNFYVNSTGAYFIGGSLDMPVVYWYRGFYYVFAPNDGMVDVYRMGEDCFERVTSVKTNLEGSPNFAVAVPYLVVQVSENELLAINVARNATAGILDLRETESGTYFRGVTVVKGSWGVELKGDEPEKPPKPLNTEVADGKLKIPEKGVELSLRAVAEHLWDAKEAGHLRAYELENAILLVPPDVTHYFAPDANSTGEMLAFGNESVSVRGISEVSVLYYDGSIRAFSLGEARGSRFVVTVDNVTFSRCEVPRTYALEFWVAVVLLALIGFTWFFTVRKG